MVALSATMAGMELWSEDARLLRQENPSEFRACPVCLGPCGSLMEQLSHQMGNKMSFIELPALPEISAGESRDGVYCSGACRAAAGDSAWMFETRCVPRKHKGRQARKAQRDPCQRFLEHAAASGHASTFLLTARVLSDAAHHTARTADAFNATAVRAECGFALSPAPMGKVAPWWELVSDANNSGCASATKTAVEFRENGGRKQIVVSAMSEGGLDLDDGRTSKAIFDEARCSWELLLEALAHQLTNALPGKCEDGVRTIKAAIPFKLFGELLRCVEIRTVEFEFGVPPLARYVEALRLASSETREAAMRTLGPAAAAIAETQAAARAAEKEGALGAMVRSMVAATGASQTSHTGDEDDAAIFGSLRIPPPRAAQHMAVTRVRSVFGPQDVEAVLELGEREASGGGMTNLKTGSEHWRTQYISARGAFAKSLPELAARLLEVARRADKTEKWGLLEGREALAIRCVELHDVAASGALADTRHFDRGSLVTVDVMLSAAADFEGGTFQTLEADGVLLAHDFVCGDALVWPSHKYHCVAQVSRGRRRVLVVEFWQGRARECPHRCTTHWGRCPQEPTDGDHVLDFAELTVRAPGLFRPLRARGLYPRVGQLRAAAATDGEAEATPNVAFAVAERCETGAPLRVTVTALRAIEEGEPLVLADDGEDEDGEDESLVLPDERQPQMQRQMQQQLSAASAESQGVSEPQAKRQRIDE